MFDTVTWRWLFPGEAHHMWAFKEAVRKAAPTEGAILDLGCGDNASFAQLRTAGRTVWGADFQSHPDLQAPHQFRLLTADGRIPFEDESMDVVCAQWVLEHVQDPVFFLEEIKRVLRPGGRLIAHTINRNHLLTIARRLTNFLPHRWTQRIIRRLYGRAEHDTFPTCYRMNSKRQLRNACEATGMNLVAIDRYADPGYYNFNRLVLHFGILFDRICEWVLRNGRIYFTVEIEKPQSATGSRRIDQAA